MSQELKVETVKKGDVLYHLDRKIELIKTLLAIDENVRSRLCQQRYV